MKVYQITAYTGQWAHRRLFFNDLDVAMKYAKNEVECDDVREVWLTIIDTDRTGSYGALELDYNGLIEDYKDN